MKKTKILYVVFIFLLLMVIGIGVFIVSKDINLKSGQFKVDGYVVDASTKNSKVEVFPFDGGSTYNYKKYDNKITFVSKDKTVRVDESKVIHYQDRSLVVLKNTVGLNLETIDNDIIFYYNIYQNTNILYDNGKYVIPTKDNDNITFDSLLLRIDENKYLIAGNDIRVTTDSDKIINFGDYLYFEFSEGSIVKLYNNNDFYQYSAKGNTIVCGSVSIDLGDGCIRKSGKNTISLTNLVIDMNGNIDVLVEEEEELKVGTPSVNPDVLDGGASNTDEGSTGSGGTIEGDLSGGGATAVTEETVDSNKKIKEPEYKVTALNLTAMKIDSTIEITDEDSVLVTPTDISIVENATAKPVYEVSTEQGDLYATVTYPDLKPDTEYTLYAKASYKIDDVEYTKSFVSKIFRTEALGVYFEKSYVTGDTIFLNLYKEKYSKVASANIGIFAEDGSIVDYKTVYFNEPKTEVFFDRLNHDTTYMVKMYNILSDGVIVKDGFNQKENISTLKLAPEIGELEYSVSKSSASFEIGVSTVKDPDYGIKKYKYEIFDARQDLTTSAPIMVLERDAIGPVTLSVDGVKLQRGVAYTYRVVVEFFDNEKIVEYVASLGKNMQLDGVAFPTVRWAETYVTWEQINGTIIIDDPSNTIVSDQYKVVYKNSIDVYTTMSITTDTVKNELPITINYLRANETYTFDVYATINLQDGNPVSSQTYIGSVKVQTGLPDPMSAIFTDAHSFSDAFSINFSLTSADNVDATFEASTLSSLSFTLYQGSSTNGAVAASFRAIDRDEREYESMLKTTYFESNDIVIDPSFFGRSNEDFNQKTYTLVVDGSYDYTGYDTNILPILKNTYTFEVNDYVPGLPDSGENQVNVQAILNRNALSYGLEYDDRLNPNTVIGYNIAARYDNNSNTGVYVKYYVYRYNQFTNEFEKISALNKQIRFESDGSLPSTIYLLQDGTPYDVVDSDVMRRGNEYYFTYEAYIDADSNGTIDTVYPNDLDSNFVMKSRNLKPEKQSPTFITYPSDSSDASFTWKYKGIDIDNIVESGFLYGFMDAEATPFDTLSLDLFHASEEGTETFEQSEFKEARFEGISGGHSFSMRTGGRPLKGDNLKYSTVASQYFYGNKSSLGLSYHASLETNSIVLTLEDYESKIDLIESIASLDVVVTPTNPAKLEELGTKKLKNVNLTNDKIIIDLYDVADYAATEIQLDLYAYFDTGRIGFDVGTDYVALQTGTYDGAGSYYYHTGSKIALTSNVFGNMLTASFSYSSLTITATNLANKNFTMHLSEVNSSGVIYDKNNVIMKGIALEQLSSSDNSVTFSKIIPGVDILDSKNKVNITPLLSSVKVNATILITSASVIRDNLIYMEIYETDENGTHAVLVRNQSNEVSEFEQPVLIDDLKPQTNYYLKFYTYLYDRSRETYVKTYLYDVDQKVVGLIYNFHTISDVGISNVVASFEADSYMDKNLVITYDLENVNGFDHIEYVLYEFTEDGYVDTGISISNDTVFFKSMKKMIDATPGVNPAIKYGGVYKILIRPVGYYTEEGSEEPTELELGAVTREFTLENYREPYVGISSGKSLNYVYFRVSISDLSYIIRDGVYHVRLLDKNNNVVASQENVPIEQINRRFIFSDTRYDLHVDEYYTFEMYMDVDYNNSGEDFVVFSKTKNIKFGTEIDLGSVMVSGYANESSHSIEMVFSDSYRLSSITKVVYTITSVTTGYYLSGQSNFTTTYDATNDLYNFNLSINDKKYTPGVAYTLTVNYYENDRLVTQEEYDYFATGGSNS